MIFFKYNAKKVWLTDTDIFIELEDGTKTSAAINRFPLLAKASKEQRDKFEIINGYALHWPGLGEDLSIAGFFEAKTNTNGEVSSALAGAE